MIKKKHQTTGKNSLIVLSDIIWLYNL